MNNSCLCSFCSSDAKNSGFRRAIGTNDTPLNSIFSLVSGKIKISGFRSHFGLKIDRSSEQNESNSSFLSANWMQNDQISGIQPVERANHRWLWIGTSFCSFLISLAVLIVGKQKIISNLNSRNGYYPFNRYSFGSNPAKLGKSIEIRSETEFWDSQRTVNSPRTCPEVLEHVSACFRRVSGRNTAENLPKLIKVHEIHPKSGQIIPNPPNPSKIKVSEKKSRFFSVFGPLNYF